MIPYSTPKLSDLYTLSQSKLLENHTLHCGTYHIWQYSPPPHKCRSPSLPPISWPREEGYSPSLRAPHPSFLVFLRLSSYGASRSKSSLRRFTFSAVSLVRTTCNKSNYASTSPNKDIFDSVEVSCMKSCEMLRGRTQIRKDKELRPY